MSTYITNNCASCVVSILPKTVECVVFWAGYPSWLYKDYPYGYGGAGGGGRWLVATIRVENLINGAWLETVYKKNQWDDSETSTSTGSGDVDYGLRAGDPGYVGATDFIDTTLNDTSWNTDTVNYYDHSIVYQHRTRTLSVDNGIDVWRPQLESVVDTFDFTPLSAFQTHSYHYDATGLVDDGVTTIGIGCSVAAGFTFDRSIAPYLTLAKRQVTIANAAYCVTNQHRDSSDDYQTAWDGSAFAAPSVDLITTKHGCNSEVVTIDAYPNKLGPTTLYFSSCIYCDSCASIWPTICNPAP